MGSIGLVPVDAVRLSTVMDNSTDLTLESSERVRRPPLDAMPTRWVDVVAGEAWNPFRAEHGFALVEVASGERTYRLLFDRTLTRPTMSDSARR